MIEPIPNSKPPQPPYPAWFDEDATCAYHSGAKGHTLENCYQLKRVVQGIIDEGRLTFDTRAQPNVRVNPLPNHGGNGVNAISEGHVYVKRKVEEVTTPLEVVYRALLKAQMIAPSQCEENEILSHKKFQKQLQAMMDSGTIEFYVEEKKDTGVNMMNDGYEESPKQKPSLIVPISATQKPSLMIPVTNKPTVGIPIQKPSLTVPVAPKPVLTIPVQKPKLVIHVPAPFPYQSNKQVPWNYDSTVQQVGEQDSDANSANITGVGGMTRSGRCYSPELAIAVQKEKEKAQEEGVRVAIPVNQESMKQAVKEVAQPVTENDALEFLKFIKQSEYSVVEQLNKMPAKISILALLLNSEAHRKALLRILNQSYVSQNITVANLEHIAGGITAADYISFTDEEIPPGGRGIYKALHITTRCKDHMVAKVLIDNGSALNVMPLSTLTKLPVDHSMMKASQLIVRAFDGTRREVVGEMTIPVIVGPVEFEILFQVMDIAPAYSYLLGRPWPSVTIARFPFL